MVVAYVIGLRTLARLWLLGILQKNATEYIEEDGIGNFEESWHLNYYGPNGPKSR